MRLSSPSVPVTPDNFNRAETQMHFAWTIKLAGGLGRFYHRRDIMPVDWQTVVRPNRDTLYSAAVFDLAASPVTITLPDTGARFMSMLILDEDQFVPIVVHGPRTCTLTKESIGTRYAMAEVRLLVDPRDPDDRRQAHDLQDAMQIDQPVIGRFEPIRWDNTSQRRVREALLALGRTIPDSRRMFGSRAHVDPVRHLIGTAFRWGGNPESEATYLNVTPEMNDGNTIYRLTAGDVPVDGFWSVSVYDKDGYFEPNSCGVYSVNSITAPRDLDGSVTVQFGGCDGRTPNCLHIMQGWNYMVRLYRPRPEILNGSWIFPQAEPVAKSSNHPPPTTVVA